MDPQEWNETKLGLNNDLKVKLYNRMMQDFVQT